MDHNKLIGSCEYCNQDYCQECTEFQGWERFCSPLCRDDQEREDKLSSQLIDN